MSTTHETAKGSRTPMAIEKLPINTIRSFPFYYMHSALLSDTRHILQVWSDTIKNFAQKLCKILVKFWSYLQNLCRSSFKESAGNGLINGRRQNVGSFWSTWFLSVYPIEFLVQAFPQLFYLYSNTVLKEILGRIHWCSWTTNLWLHHWVQSYLPIISGNVPALWLFETEFDITVNIWKKFL